MNPQMNTPWKSQTSDYICNNSAFFHVDSCHEVNIAKNTCDKSEYQQVIYVIKRRVDDI